MNEQDFHTLLWNHGHYRLSLYYAKYVAQSTGKPFVVAVQKPKVCALCGCSPSKADDPVTPGSRATRFNVDPKVCDYCCYSTGQHLALLRDVAERVTMAAQ